MSTREELYRGRTHIYYGFGPGKSTACFGLAMRCAGWGEKVVLAQFLKGGSGGEVRAIQNVEGVTLLRYDGSMKFVRDMDEAERTDTARVCQELFEKAAALAAEQEARLLILDEVIDTVPHFLPMERLCAFLDRERPEHLEVVMSGHSLPAELAKRADYITQVCKEKHPYDGGLDARRGIEF